MDLVELYCRGTQETWAEHPADNQYFHGDYNSAFRLRQHRVLQRLAIFSHRQLDEHWSGMSTHRIVTWSIHDVPF